MKDSEKIIKNYWKSFNQLFPNIKKEELVKFTEEDIYQGWEELGYTGPAGRRELKMLYALIRIIKPKKILEIGTYKGDSANHVLLACEKNRNEGYTVDVTLLDIKNFLEKKLHDSNFTRVLENSINHLPNSDYDLIIQDGSHNYTIVKKELELFNSCKNLKFVWAHDYYLPGRGVKQAWDEVGKKVFKQWIPFSDPEYAAGFIIAKK